MKQFSWNNLTGDEQKKLLARPISETSSITDSVAEIIKYVRSDGDQALLSLTEKFDGVLLEDLNSRLRTPNETLDANVLSSIKTAINRITHYQTQCLPKNNLIDTQDGIICMRLYKPIERVGLYVPGGSAPLISTLMMLAIPAKIADCPTRIVCTPPDRNGAINPWLLKTAELCGVSAIYPVGGAQAIAAMAYGTQSIPKVDKIFGPGNSYVTAAKQWVANDSQGAAIDMPAGPSELLIIADENANPEFVAADLLSQAEHGADSQVILITNSTALARDVNQSIEQQVSQLERAQIIKKSLAHARLILVDNLDTAFAISNRYAPEHLLLQLKNAQDRIASVKNAGAVFVGAWTPESMGDYINGANHVLPTDGFASRVSGLSVTDFIKAISVQRINEEGLRNLGPAAMNLAATEGLTAHKNAIALRLANIEALT